MNKPRPPVNVGTGEFPFPLSRGTDESRYLTWVRNHSNYMAERGVLDYLRLVAVLVRGIVINFVTLMPYMLLGGLLVATIKRVELPTDHPYALTIIMLGLASLWVLLFPVIMQLFKIIRYRMTVETGSSSSVKSRDSFERSFGAFCLLVLAVAALESLPFLLKGFHALIHDRAATVARLAPVLGGIGTILLTANKLIQFTSGWVRKMAVLVVGATGFLVPLAVVLAAADFIGEGHETSIPNILLLIILPVVFGLGLLVAMTLGFNAFRLREKLRILALALGMYALLGATIYLILRFDTDNWNGRFVITFLWMVEIWIFCQLTVDVNLTSIHGLYRDRLATAFLVGEDTKGDVDIENDIDLQEICQYETGSTAPYHLVNVALNLQGSKDISIRERNSDFFIFSKNFIGGRRTGYCPSGDMETVYPQIDLATAMAVSAAAASPNMGTSTSRLMVAFLTLLNVRLGYWIPHPGRLAAYLSKKRNPDRFPEPEPLQFRHVFRVELKEVERRRANVFRRSDAETERPLASAEQPSTDHNLVGIGFSGGGIRSAALNMGISQALHQRGIFDLLDYMSTVSGGGYLGSSISALMRYKTSPRAGVAGKVAIDRESDPEALLVNVQGTEGTRRYRYSREAILDQGIEEGATVREGRRLLQRHGSGLNATPATGKSWEPGLLDWFRWRVRPSAIFREITSKLDENSEWVNLSDGGHIENMAAIELLRRRCRIIIIGDGEADPEMGFHGLATLIRYARIDLGTRIHIDLTELGLANRKSKVHHAVGRISYPGDETGYLLYLKSSFTGDEDAVISEYRHRNPDFPHESTADQFFDEGQFEAYRALGQHIAETALARLDSFVSGGEKISLANLEAWLAASAPGSGQ